MATPARRPVDPDHPLHVSRAPWLARGGPTQPVKGELTRPDSSHSHKKRIIVECEDDATLDAVHNIVSRLEGVRVTLDKAGGHLP